MNRDLILIAARDQLPGETMRDFILREKIGYRVKLITDGAQALDFIINERPGVVILDSFMHTMSASTLLEELNKYNLHPQTVVIFREKDLRLELLLVKKGARGIIDFTMGVAKTKEILCRICRGMSAYPEEIDERIQKRDFELHHEKYKSLTKKQTQVMHLVAEGLTDCGIAKHLFVTIKTVEKHKSAIKKRLGLVTSVEIASYAFSHNFIKIRREDDC